MIPCYPFIAPRPPFRMPPSPPCPRTSFSLSSPPFGSCRCPLTPLRTARVGASEGLLSVSAVVVVSFACACAVALFVASMPRP
jgi:hypothetical protein